MKRFTPLWGDAGNPGLTRWCQTVCMSLCCCEFNDCSFCVCQRDCVAELAGAYVALPWLTPCLLSESHLWTSTVSTPFSFVFTRLHEVYVICQWCIFSKDVEIYSMKIEHLCSKRVYKWTFCACGAFVCVSACVCRQLRYDCGDDVTC